MVIESVLSVIEKIVADAGPVNVDAPSEADGGDPKLQAVYLGKVARVIRPRR